jgi:disulfide bond formation protein DsbB
MLDREYWDYGRKVFMGTCISCHGPDGRGIAGNGKDLVHSAFVRDSSDDDLVEFIKKGRDLNDPLNTTKILMPPKGGNPAMSEDDMYDVVEYLRGLQDPRRIPAPGTPPAESAESQAETPGAGGSAQQ